MKLNSLFVNKNVEIANKYISDLKKLKRTSTLSESKITITIDDKPETPGISKEAKEVFIDKASKIGNFSNAEWVSKLVNGLKQVGVQGINEIVEDEHPVTNKDIRELIGLLIELIK
jgi:hypothetical protein